MRLLALLLFLAAPLSAQCPITLTATGGGYYYVTVNGDSLSAHSTERAAAAKAISVYRQDSTKAVGYTQTYQVRVGGCAGGVRVDTLPGRVDTVYVTRPDSTPPVVPPPPPPPPPVDTTTPAPPATGHRFVSAERFAAWAALKAANHPFWQQAVTTCAATGTSGEAYADNGEWCALVAATTNDATAAGKAIAKLRQIGTGAGANEVREYFIARILQRDLLAPWLTPADYAAIDPVLTQWAGRASAINAADSDQMTGNGCGAILWDIATGTPPTRPNVTNAIARFVAVGRGGQWIESAEYNMGTVVLLTQCQIAYRKATGNDVVPGVAQFLADAGTVGAFELTPDGKAAIQWGDDQYPRDLRLYRRVTFLSALPNPYAQGAVQGFLAGWPISSASLMARALFYAHPEITPQALPSQAVHVAPGMGMLYRRDGALLQWAMVLPKTGVHHTDITAPMDLQVYRNGWLLTGSIGYGYGVHELGQNAPVYAGLNLFSQSGMTWADSGHGWAAIAGVTRGTYFTSAYPAPPEFLHYGGRVVVQATVGGNPVAIVRDSVAMDDPRTLPNYASYRTTGTYPHQQRITEFDGKFWALWHAPQQPTVTGNEVRWTAATGEAVKVTTCQPVQVALVNEQGVLTGTIKPSEIRWQARLHPSGPVLVQVFSLAGASVGCQGDRVTVDGVAFTVTSTGVVGP